MRDRLGRRKPGLGTAAAALALTVLLGGCSLDYKSAEVAQKLPANVPDTALTDFVSTTMRGDRPYFRVTAQTAETFAKKNETILTDVQFEEFDKEGKVVADGRANRAVYHTDTQNAELSGDLSLYSAAEKATFKTDYLSWNDHEKRLAGTPDGVVRITKESGSFLEGRGFTATTRTRSFEFEHGVEGRWVGPTGK